MKFANRMDRFGEGVFSMLAQMKKKKLAEGEMIVDLSTEYCPRTAYFKGAQRSLSGTGKLPVCNSGSAGTSGGSVRLVCAPLWSGAEPGDRDLLFARFPGGTGPYCHVHRG